jgi:hypothetical protein
MHRGRHVRPRRDVRDDHLNLGLSLATRGLEHLEMVGWSQMGREQSARRQAHRSRGEHVEDRRKSARRAGDLDACVGLRLRQTESIAAIDEERAVTLAQVHVARVQLGEMGHELCGRHTLARYEASHARDEVRVREATKRIEQSVLHDRL